MLWVFCCGGWGAGWLVVLGAAASSGSLAEGTMLFFGLLHVLLDWTKGHLTVLSSAIARCGNTGAGRLGSLSVCWVFWFAGVCLPLPSPLLPRPALNSFFLHALRAFLSLSMALLVPRAPPLL